MKPFSYIQPTTLAEASAAAQKDGALLKAAGIDVVDLLKERKVTPSEVVNLLPLTAAMAGVASEADGGVLTDLSAVAVRLSVPEPHPHEASRRSGTPPERAARGLPATGAAADRDPGPPREGRVYLCLGCGFRRSFSLPAFGCFGRGLRGRSNLGSLNRVRGLSGRLGGGGRASSLLLGVLRF